MISKIATITAKFLSAYLVNKDEGPDDLHTKSRKLKCLVDIFADYGGLLGKVSQMLSLNNPTINSVFADCKPYSAEQTTDYFKNIILTDPTFKNIKKIDYDVFKAGSVGQLYKAEYDMDESIQDIVIKVQYVGLRSQFEEDLSVIHMISKFLYNFFDDITEKEIVSKLYEELDYTIEYNNQLTMSLLWEDDKDIYIPKMIKSLCTETILTSELIQAETLPEFINNSTQEQRNKIGMSIYRFIYTNFVKHGLFYSDIHYGNFLIRNKTELVVIDFGCVNKIDDNLLKNILSLQSSVMIDDEDLFYTTVSNMGVLDNNNISKESKDYMWEYFKLQLQPQVNDNFTFSDEWVDKITNKNMDLMKDWNLPSNCAYLNKLNYGFPHVLCKLNTTGDTMKVFCDIIVSCTQ